MIKIYTDGSCIGNPGSGGWAAIIISSGEKNKISGNIKNTTNNQMELMAPIKALELFTKKERIKIYTDSLYVKDGITKWIKNWEKNNWKTSKKKQIKNIDLWKKLNILSNFHNVEWNWVKAHDGNSFNIMADKLAKQAALA